MIRTRLRLAWCDDEPGQSRKPQSSNESNASKSDTTGQSEAASIETQHTEVQAECALQQSAILSFAARRIPRARRPTLPLSVGARGGKPGSTTLSEEKPMGLPGPELGSMSVIGIYRHLFAIVSEPISLISLPRREASGRKVRAFTLALSGGASQRNRSLKQ
jgi:hypothetical protein